MKKWLNENKIYFETITALLLSIMALMVFCTQSNIAKNQLLLTENPRVLFYPPEKSSDTPGKINLTIENPSLSDVYDIEIFEDYFLATNPTNENLQLIRYGAMILDPNSTIKNLKSKTSTTQPIDYFSTFELMKKAYPKQTGFRMFLVRIIIKYKREIDGKQFENSKVFVIDASGQIWIDYDMRGLSIPYSISMESVKNILGIKN